jgi:hypothetical protein
VQLLAAICLIAGLTALVLVALFSPLRAVLAQEIITVAHAGSALFGAHARANVPEILCGVSGGGCP